MKMLKGCQRRIIMVKDTGSRYFDSAYFVIKSDLPSSCKDSDMLLEAHKLIDAYSINPQIKNKKSSGVSAGSKNMLAILGLAVALILVISLLVAILISL